MDWKFTVEKLSETTYHIAIMISVVSLLKLGIIQWTMIRIASIKVSRIVIKKGQRIATYSNPDENAKVIEILKNGNDMDVDEKFYDDVS